MGISAETDSVANSMSSTCAEVQSWKRLKQRRGGWRDVCISVVSAVSPSVEVAALSGSVL